MNIMEGVNGQLQTKYQKIATEYSKIRAQANVLKKAVIDEQTRNADIREQLKEKEVELRKAEQELDSLSFRNQQLTKRITVLQDELDKMQIKSKKGKNKSESNSQIPAQPNHILDEEFQKKIVENAQLLSQINDKDSEIESLNDRIQQLQYKLDHCEKSKVELECQYQSTVDKIERERNDLQRKLNEKQRQEETVSWSSNEGKRDGYDFDARLGLSNHRQTELSPFSSPLASRRSSKSIGEGKPHKTQEENNEFDFPKSCDVEKEMNYWKAQYHILKIKYDEVEQKECLSNTQIENEPLQPIKINHMIGRLTVPFAIPEEIEAREAKIRDYFLQEIDKLIIDKHIYHVKNLAMAANSEVMQVHVDTSELKRKKCESALTEAFSNCSILQKDKEIQEGNYKTQLSTMSEHLANMNEKLISQTEEIQQLKFELANKNNKKGKQK